MKLKLSNIFKIVSTNAFGITLGFGRVIDVLN